MPKRSEAHRGNVQAKQHMKAGVKGGSKGSKVRKAETTSDHTVLERESSSPTSTHEEKRVVGRPFVKGDPRIKPGPGRPTEKFKKWCAKVIADPRTKRAVRRVMQNPRHKAQTSMWKAVASHAHGQPTAHVDMTHKVTLEDLVDASHEDKDS